LYRIAPRAALALPQLLTGHGSAWR